MTSSSSSATRSHPSAHAPPLRADVPSAEPLARQYERWASHHAMCPQCSAEPWYEPDHARLCERGQRLFTGWLRGSLALRPLRSPESEGA